MAGNGEAMQLQTLFNDDNYILQGSCPNESSGSILHRACVDGETALVKEILTQKTDLATTLNQDGFSPIHIASAKGFAEIVTELLVNGGPELGRLKSSDGRTPLHFAAIAGKVRVVMELLRICPECVVDETSRGETALHLAVRNNQFETFKAMIDMIKCNQDQILDIQKLLNKRDEDGNTILHIATAKMQNLIVKLLLNDRDIQKGTIKVNIVNESGLTALDVLDVVQQVVYHSADYKLRELLLHVGALRARDLEVANCDDDDALVVNDASNTNPIPRPQNVWHFLLDEIKLLNPMRYYRNLAREAAQSPPVTQNALMVVAVLTATLTYQAILNPPDGISNDDDDNSVGSPLKPMECILFFVPNSVGFFASLVVITLLIQKFPLKSLLTLTVRCMAASYICGLFLIGPNSASTTDLIETVIGLLVSFDVLHFCFRLFKRWSKAIREERAAAGPGHGFAP